MKEIINKLKSDCKSDDELSIEFETSPDEAVVIGTRQAYINAAIRLLEIAGQTPASECEQDEIQGVQTVCSNHIKHAFNEFGKVWPVAAYVAKDSDRVNKLISIFKGE